MAEKDMTEKTLESCSDVFADIVNVLLFNGRQKVKESELEQAVPRSVYKADRKLREQERDTAKYWRRRSIRLSLFGIENETESENDMPLRVLGYDGASYRDQLYYVKGSDGKYRRNTNPRYPVITAVLYFGTTHWNRAVTVYESLADNLDEDLKPFVSDYKINLFEIAFLTDEQVAMFKSDFRIVADYFVQMRKNKSYKPSDIQFKHVREVLQLMSVLTRDTRFEEAASAAVAGKEVSNMCEVLNTVEKRGEERGAQKKAKETAINMKSRGFSNQDISDLVGIELGTVNDWFPEDYLI